MSLGTTSNRWLKRPTPNASRRYPFKSSTTARSCSYALFPWVALLSAKKYGTPYFSVRKRTSKYSRSCSFVAELLSLRKTGTLRYIRIIGRGASPIVDRQRFDRRRVAASFWFAESFVSGIVPRTAAVSDDTKRLHQEVVRVVLLDGQLRCITKVDISSGTVNESLAAPLEIFRPAIIHCAYAFVLVHTTHQAVQTLPKRTENSLSASRRQRRFFKSISWIM